MGFLDIDNAEFGSRAFIERQQDYKDDVGAIERDMRMASRAYAKTYRSLMRQDKASEAFALLLEAQKAGIRTPGGARMAGSTASVTGMTIRCRKPCNRQDCTDRQEASSSSTWKPGR